MGGSSIPLHLLATNVDLIEAHMQRQRDVASVVARDEPANRTTPSTHKMLLSVVRARNAYSGLREGTLMKSLLLPVSALSLSQRPVTSHSAAITLLIPKDAWRKDTRAVRNPALL